jgi:hypothetical protein
MDQKEFPIQGRYGKGVIAWDLSGKVRLAGIVVDKPNHMATLHSTKGAPKSTRLDAVTMRKRAATKGDLVVEVKPGEEVVSVNVGWTVEKYVALANGRENGKKNGSVGAKGNGKPAVKKSIVKAKPAAKKTSAKPRKSPSKGKAPTKKSAPKKKKK